MIFAIAILCRESNNNVARSSFLFRYWDKRVLTATYKYTISYSNNTTLSRVLIQPLNSFQKFSKTKALSISS